MGFKSLIRSDVSDVFLDTDDFADVCAYSGSFTGDIPMVVSWTDPQRPIRRDLAELDGIIAQGAICRCAISSFTADDPTVIPQSDDEIIWIDQNNQRRTLVVFPRVGEHCFDYSPDRAMLTLYAFDADDLTVATYTTPEPADVPWRVIAGQQVGGAEGYYDADTEKTVRMNIYGPRSVLAAAGVTEIQRNAQVTVNRELWAVEVHACHFGSQLVRIGLKRQSIISHEEMESHGSV